MKDSEIARCVQILLALLHDEPNLVRTEVENGVVYLQGLAADAQQKYEIQDAIRYVSGVRGVVNCLALEHVARLPTASPPIPAATVVEQRLAPAPRRHPHQTARARSHSSTRPFSRRGLRPAFSVNH